MKTFPASHLKGVLVQMTSGEDIDRNLNEILDLLNQINEPQNLDLVCFPENCLFFRIGAQMNSLNLRDPAWEPLKDFADKNQIVLFFGGVAIEQNGVVYNGTVVVEPNNQVNIAYKKIHLFDVDVVGQKSIRESDQFGAGKEPTIYEIKDWKIGLSVCYDVRFSELYRYYAGKGVHCIMIPAAFLVPTGKAHWHCLMRARAIESQAFVLAAAQSGEHKAGEKSRFTFGHSLAVDPWGNILADGKQESPQIIPFELDPKLLEKAHNQIPMWNHRDPNLWGRT